MGEWVGVGVGEGWLGGMGQWWERRGMWQWCVVVGWGGGGWGQRTVLEEAWRGEVGGWVLGGGVAGGIGTVVGEAGRGKWVTVRAVYVCGVGGGGMGQ